MRVGAEVLVIRLTPDSPGGRALALVVRYPGEVDAAVLAAHLWPPTPMPRPVGTLEERARIIGAWRREWYGVPRNSRTGAPAVPGRVHENVSRAGRILGRLQEAGMVRTMGEARVAEWFAERIERYGLARALDRVGLPATAARLFEVGESPPSVKRGKRSGAGERLYRKAVAAGVIVAPTLREATEAGVDLVCGRGAA